MFNFCSVFAYIKESYNRYENSASILSGCFKININFYDVVFDAITQLDFLKTRRIIH